MVPVNFMDFKSLFLRLVLERVMEEAAKDVYDEFQRRNIINASLLKIQVPDINIEKLRYSLLSYVMSGQYLILNPFH